MPLVHVQLRPHAEIGNGSRAGVDGGPDKVIEHDMTPSEFSVSALDSGLDRTDSIAYRFIAAS